MYYLLCSCISETALCVDQTSSYRRSTHTSDHLWRARSRSVYEIFLNIHISIL